MEQNNKNLIPHVHMPNLNMELFTKYEVELAKVLSSDKERYWHSISVALTAVTLADTYNANKDDCLVAGLLHDYCKCMSVDEMLRLSKEHGLQLSDEDIKADGCIHGFLAAKLCKDKFGINDEVYNAIYYHTCGKPNMNALEKIIYISDFIEPLRRFRDRVSDIRRLCFTNIDLAIVKSSEASLEFLKRNNKFIHSNTIKTLEYYKEKCNVK